ncbi:MAG: hypothetical protein OXN91_00520 [Chloroflexota bacterium]|nr:hypothetical protein [Chloroflexota bacterium]
MGDPMIRVMKRRPVSSGFWVQNFRGGDLIYADAHLEAGSAVASAYPVMDRCDAYHVERAIDWILNAASASRDRLARAFRAIYPGSRVESEVLPSDWWGRQFDGVVGIDFSAYLGNDATESADRSHGGLVIEDNTAELVVSGFAGGTSNSDMRGRGPGGGCFQFGGPQQGTNGGHGTSGGGLRHGPLVPAGAALAALLTGSFTADNLGMGGGGGSGPAGRDGGDAGDGFVRRSSSNIVESQSRNLSGSAGQRDAGHGSGGGYYAISRRGFEFSTGTTINLGNGSNSSTHGKGRLTTFTVDQPTISGTVSNGVLTHFQIYPSIPLGAVRVM